MKQPPSDPKNRTQSMMEQYCFADSFNVMSVKQRNVLIGLLETYPNGTIPRRVLSSVAKEIGMSQAKIRRWMGERCAGFNEDILKLVIEVKGRQTKLSQSLLKIKERMEKTKKELLLISNIILS